MQIRCNNSEQKSQGAFDQACTHPHSPEWGLLSQISENTCAGGQWVCRIFKSFFAYILFILLQLFFPLPSSPHPPLSCSTCPLFQARLDFRDPLMVSLEFGLADEDQGPVLDESLPRSINKTVRESFTCKSLSQHVKYKLLNNSKQKI